KPYVVANAEVLFDALAAEPGTPQRAAGDAARRDLARRLHEILDRSSIPDLERDRLIARAVNDLSSRRAQQAMSNLMSELATRFQGPMRQLAEQMDDSPWLAINRTIEDGLREMATAVSLTDLNKPSETG